MRHAATPAAPSVFPNNSLNLGDFKTMCHSTFFCIGLTLAALNPVANANTFRFDTDPFAGTNVLNTPGRQVVGGEPFINFSIANDVFSLESTVFGTAGTISFANAAASSLSNGVNVIVLESGDDDNNLLTPFGAGNAANLIASRVTTPGAGFFIYFNQPLDLARLVYSTDLSNQNADLKILARMTNLNGAAGRNALPTFTASNFDITNTPEPSSLFLTGPVLGGLGWIALKRRQRTAA